MATKAKKIQMLDRVAINSEERGTKHYNLAKETDDLNQLKAMVSAYRTAISATLTGVRIETMPYIAKKATMKKLKKAIKRNFK